jgi:alanyl-tRNA synthetase
VVTDTQKDGGILQHHGYLADGEMNVGARVTARVDSGCRDAIRRSHSATHILHFALQKNLGQHAQQQGSKVDHDWLRFDFTNLSPVNDDQLATIQRDVDEKVHAALPISWEIVPLADARMAGAMMLFGEKYPDPVRMVSMGDFSKELCGGTHLASTGDVVSFEIISEESVSAGTRRIVALTGDKAAEHIQGIREAVICAAQAAGVPPQALPDAAAALAQSVRELKKQLAGGGQVTSASGPVPSAAGEPTYADLKNALQGAARVLNVAPLDVPDRIVALQAEIAELHRQVEQREAAGPLSAEALLANAEEVEGVRVIVAEAAAANPTLLRGLIDQLRKTASPVAVLLASCPGKDKVLLVAGVSHDLVDQGVHAGNWVRDVAAVVGGGGGGKPDMAQAGGKQPEKLPEALETARAKIRATLGG